MNGATFVAALRQWTRNGDALPADLPGYVREFMEEARRLPGWVDQSDLEAGFTFTTKRGTYLGVLYGMASGMMSTAIPREARAVYYSEGGADMKDRISKTAKLGYDIGTRDAFAPEGEMIVTCVKTRMIHAAVRHLLPQSPHWAAAADEDVPISQRDMMVTWHSLATTVMQKLREWQIPIAAAESQGFLHTWQLTARMLGIREEYIPASWAEADEQAAQVLAPVLGPTPEGVALADILLDLGQQIDGGIASRPFLEAFTRYTLGDEIAGWLEIPRRPGLDESIAAGWPAFIRFREAGLAVPFTPAGYWTFDEFLRRSVLLYMSEGQPISIELPDGNNPDHE